METFDINELLSIIIYRRKDILIKRFITVVVMIFLLCIYSAYLIWLYRVSHFFFSSSDIFMYISDVASISSPSWFSFRSTFRSTTSYPGSHSVTPPFVLSHFALSLTHVSHHPGKAGYYCSSNMHKRSWLHWARQSWV